MGHTTKILYMFSGSLYYLFTHTRFHVTAESPPCCPAHIWSHYLFQPRCSAPSHQFFRSHHLSYDPAICAKSCFCRLTYVLVTCAPFIIANRFSPVQTQGEILHLCFLANFSCVSLLKDPIFDKLDKHCTATFQALNDHHRPRKAGRMPPCGVVLQSLFPPNGLQGQMPERGILEAC